MARVYLVGIRCSKCGGKTKVLRTIPHKNCVIRYRRCIDCHVKIKTEETALTEIDT